MVGLRPLVVGPRKKFVLIWILLHGSLFYWDCTFGKCPNELDVALNEYINVEAIQNHVPLLKLPLVLGQV